MGIDIRGKIEKMNGKNLSYKDFVERYLSKNQPVVLTGLMDDWRACKDWVTPDNLPNLSFLTTHFGKSMVQVADCGTRDFTDQKRVEMSLSEFIQQWIEGGGDGKSVLYLKDWHFVKEYPRYVPYKTPLFFCDDWLNLYLDHHRMHNDPDAYQGSNEICCSDYRFVYMGVKGSWTPLHTDVFRSYSWSANVCGRKRWLFLSPSQHHLLFDRNLKSSVYNIFDDVSESKFPGFKKAIWLECIQEQNEIIFVPSGWYHQVHNLDDTISINHNWFNAYNLSWVWDLLLRDYKEAKEYIEDVRDICDDFEGLCQRNLAANTGMNFFDFLVFLFQFFLANVVLLCWQNGESTILLWGSSQLTKHLAFNILSIRKTVLGMESLDGIARNHGIFMDVQGTLDDPEFQKMCIDMGRKYGAIYEQKNCSCDANKALMAEFLDHVTQICTPEEFLKFIDSAVSKLSVTCFEENILLTAMDA